jgi:hypothetical protein
LLRAERGERDDCRQGRAASWGSCWELSGPRRSRVLQLKLLVAQAGCNRANWQLDPDPFSSFERTPGLTHPRHVDGQASACVRKR